MLLALDVRNRAISIGFFGKDSGGQAAKDRWLVRRRLGAIPGRSADEYALLLRSFADEAGAGEGPGPGVPARRVESAWMSSVAPSLGRELSLAVYSAFGLGCSTVGPGVRTGVKIRTDVPSEVGSDLVCAAVAAKDLVGVPCVIVDFDAAIAFSALGRTGDFLGAAIAPGIGTAAEALRDAAALLPEVSVGEGPRDHPAGPLPAIGKNTAESIRAGIGIGFSGLVERIARRQAEELAAMGEADSPDAVAVIGTGGDEGRLIFASLGVGRFVPDLVLEGLAIIASRAKSPTKTIV